MALDIRLPKHSETKPTSDPYRLLNLDGGVSASDKIPLGVRQSSFYHVCIRSSPRKIESRVKSEISIPRFATTFSLY